MALAEALGTGIAYSLEAAVPVPLPLACLIGVELEVVPPGLALSFSWMLDATYGR